MKLNRVALALLAALPAAVPAAVQGDVRFFRVSQVHQVEAERPALRAYLDILDADGAPITGLSAGALSATLGEQRLEVERLEPMEGSGEGVAYVFLIDVSRSLSQAEFDRIVAEIEAWIADMRESDRAAVLAFGETSRLVVDFTPERELLIDGLRSLGPTDNLTLLHRALVDGLELLRRRDPDLPGRRVLIVLTDGRDEGSGLAVEDVLEKLRSDPAPIYAIGHSRLRDPTARRRYLDLLHRFATNSGGAFFEAEQTSFAEAYQTIRRAIRRVWLGDFTCLDCRADGRLQRFQATVSEEGRVLSDGQGIRLFPGRSPAAAGPRPDAPGEPAADAAMTETEPPSPVTAPAAVAWWRRTPVWLAALAAAIVVALVLLAGRKPRPTPVAAAPEEEEIEIVGLEPADSDAPVPLRASHPLRGVRLIVVRGSKAGRQYRMILEERATVGARSTCDCVLAGEPNVEPEQFELVQQGGRIYIKNLAEKNRTLVDGFPVDERQEIKSDDLIGTGEVILRIVFD